MNYYEMGLNSDNVGGIKTPAQIAFDIKTVNTLVSVLSADIVRSKVDQEFRTSWTTFVVEWIEFRDKTLDSWTDRLWGGTADKVDEYRERVSKYREEFVVRGGKPSTPKDETAEERKKREGGIPWEWLVKGTLIVTGIYGIAKIVEAFASARNRSTDVTKL